MAHLWTFDNSTGWATTPLQGQACMLRGGGLRHGDAALTADDASLVFRRLADASDTWALLSADAEGLHVNGLPMALGLAVLADRDEIRLKDFVGWFSTETQPHIEPLPDSVKRGFCPRCKQQVAAGSPAVRCPACGLWHHASDDLPCWTYAPTCAGCSQDTALDAGFRWTPEDL